MGKQRLATLDELQRCDTIKFDYREEGISREGFLAWHEGSAVCYENVCRHVPITLDYGDGQFFTPDKKHFVCQNHGAIYEPLTGKCIEGPCPGAFLKRLEIVVEGDTVFLLTAD